MPDGFWDRAAASSGPLTEEQFIAAAEAIRRKRPPDPCSVGQHVVSPRALTRPGLYLCANCMALLAICYPLIERA